MTFLNLSQLIKLVKPFLILEREQKLEVIKFT